MRQLGIVYQKDKVVFQYAENGTVFFSSNSDSFLQNLPIDEKNIDTVIVLKDFTEELSQVNNRVGYIKLKTDDLTLSGLLKEYSSFIKIHLIDKDMINEVLRNLKEQNIFDVAVNGFFKIDKSWNVLDLDPYEIRNKLVRENYILFNLLLTNTAKKFISQLRSKLSKIKIQAPIYFLMGSGYLTDSENIIKYPILTWRSREVFRLLSYSYFYHLDDFILIRKEGEKFIMTLMKDSVPVTNKNYSRFKGYELPPWFVKTMQFNIDDYDNTLRYFKRRYPDLPIIYELDIKKSEIEYNRYSGKVFPEEALFQVPYRKRICKKVNLTLKDSIDSSKEKLNDLMNDYLKENCICLKEIQRNFRKDYLPYLHESIVNVELVLTGELSKC
ncbi:MAG: hypothetical protein PWQ70_1688 [Clostridiales bacterium]|jgi:hypothetical protein|nr:hypothetical protein [Clostridiales bacterium]